MSASKYIYSQTVAEDASATNKNRFKVLVSPSNEASSTVSPTGVRTRHRRVSGLVVVVVDPRPLMRQIWTQALKGWARDLRVVALESADEYADYGTPAVALVNQAGRSGALLQNELEGAIARFRTHRVPVALLADSVSPKDIVRAIESGARGYIPMDSAPLLVVGIIRFVAAGGSYVPPEPFVTDLRKPSPPPARPLRVSSDDFSPQQALVLEPLSRGVSNRKIAEQLKMQESAVKAHVRHIMNKLGVTNRTQVALAVADLPQSQP